MGVAEHKRVLRIGDALADALAASEDPGAALLLADIAPLLARIRAGRDVPAPRTMPGYRFFIESGLPGDDTVRDLYHAWCDALGCR